MIRVNKRMHGSPVLSSSMAAVESSESEPTLLPEEGRFSRTMTAPGCLQETRTGHCDEKFIATSHSRSLSAIQRDGLRSFIFENLFIFSLLKVAG